MQDLSHETGDPRPLNPKPAPIFPAAGVPTYAQPSFQASGIRVSDLGFSSGFRVFGSVQWECRFGVSDVMFSGCFSVDPLFRGQKTESK